MKNKFMDMYYWLDYIVDQEGISIQHKINSGHEKRVGRYFVDGYSAECNTVFEYHGCYHHGHQCYLTRHIKDEKQVKAQEAKQKRPQAREKFLKRCGYNVVSIYECDYKKWIEPNIAKVRDRYLPP